MQRSLPHTTIDMNADYWIIEYCQFVQFDKIEQINEGQGIYKLYYSNGTQEDVIACGGNYCLRKVKDNSAICSDREGGCYIQKNFEGHQADGEEDKYNFKVCVTAEACQYRTLYDENANKIILANGDRVFFAEMDGIINHNYLTHESDTSKAKRIFAYQVGTQPQTQNQQSTTTRWIKYWYPVPDDAEIINEINYKGRCILRYANGKEEEVIMCEGTEENRHCIKKATHEQIEDKKIKKLSTSGAEKYRCLYKRDGRLINLDADDEVKFIDDVVSKASRVNQGIFAHYIIKANGTYELIFTQDQINQEIDVLETPEEVIQRAEERKKEFRNRSTTQTSTTLGKREREVEQTTANKRPKTNVSTDQQQLNIPAYEQSVQMPSQESGEYLYYLGKLALLEFAEAVKQSSFENTFQYEQSNSQYPMRSFQQFFIYNEMNGQPGQNSQLTQTRYLENPHSNQHYYRQ
jgi:hypothetical protein